MKLLLTVLIGGGVFLAALALTDAIGLRAVYLQIPISGFLAATALWPVVKDIVRSKAKRPFADWVAFEAGMMILLGLIIYGFETYRNTTALLESLK